MRRQKTAHERKKDERYKVGRHSFSWTRRAYDYTPSNRLVGAREMHEIKEREKKTCDLRRENFFSSHQKVIVEIEGRKVSHVCKFKVGIALRQFRRRWKAQSCMWRNVD
jgi:hypothetical protein